MEESGQNYKKAEGCECRVHLELESQLPRDLRANCLGHDNKDCPCKKDGKA